MEFLRDSRLPPASAAREDIEAARDNLLRRRQLHSDDHQPSPRERRAFGSEERKLNALREASLLYPDAVETMRPSWKKRKEKHVDNVLAFIGHRGRVIDHLAAHVDACTTASLLRELPQDFKTSRLSVHQQLNVQKKATVVMQYCIMMNDTCVPTSPYFQWSADQVATCVGNNFRERPKTMKEISTPAPSTPAPNDSCTIDTCRSDKHPMCGSCRLLDPCLVIVYCSCRLLDPCLVIVYCRGRRHSSHGGSPPPCPP